MAYQNLTSSSGSSKLEDEYRRSLGSLSLRGGTKPWDFKSPLERRWRKVRFPQQLTKRRQTNLLPMQKAVRANAPMSTMPHGWHQVRLCMHFCLAACQRLTFIPRIINGDTVFRWAGDSPDGPRWCQESRSTKLGFRESNPVSACP